MAESNIWKIALIGGALFLTLLMLMHPSGTHAAADAHRIVLPGRFVHAGAIAAEILIMFGVVGLCFRLGITRTWVVFGLVAFLFAAVALMVAASINGFVAPKLMKALETHKLEEAQVIAVSSFGWWLNQTLANIAAFATSAAILCWAIAWPSGGIRAWVVRVAALGAGIVPPVLLAGPFITMDVHGAALVALMQNLSLVLAALLAPKAEG